MSDQQTVSAAVEQVVFCQECGVGLREGHEHDPNYHFSGCRSLAR